MKKKLTIREKLFRYLNRTCSGLCCDSTPDAILLAIMLQRRFKISEKRRDK